MRDIRKILVIRWGGLGDLVIATAVIQDIRDACPDAIMDINTESPWDALFRNDPRFHEILTFRARGTQKYKNGITWLREISGRNYDLIIDLQNNDHSRILLACLRLFYNFPGMIAGTKKFYPYTVPAPPYTRNQHALQCMRGVLKALGIPARTDHAVLHVSDGDRSAVTELLADCGLEPGRYILLIPGSSQAGRNKRWNENAYITLARQLHDHFHDRVALVGAAADAAVCERIRAASGDWMVNLCNKTGIPDLLPLARSSRLIIGNDTGAIHITAAARRPTIVLFGCTNSAHSRPLGENVKIIQADEDLLASGRSPGPQSIQKITVNQVFNEALSAAE